MRLREIQNTIDGNLINFRQKMLPAATDGNNVTFKNVQQFKHAVGNLEKTGIFQVYIEDIKKFESVLFTEQDSITVPKKIADALVGKINQLYSKLLVFNEGISDILPDQDEYSISVKLPKIHNLKALSDISIVLNKVFEQLLVTDTIKGSFSLQNFDTGSEWLEILFNSEVAVYAISSLVYACILLKKEQAMNAELLALVRNRKLTADLYEKLRSELLERTAILLENTIKKETRKLGIPDDAHEYFEKFEYCVNETLKLIDCGLQFFPSSKARNEVKITFPDFAKKIEEMLPEVPIERKQSQDQNDLKEEEKKA
ncbi:MAG: hypothetical protein D3924_07215 [Candidatus Electrothrix sp. AR4]|nr:hypothetical protein [Candidatus Electrothrix sp. AR4]